MRSLYESLLDDEEDLLDNDDALITHELNKGLDELHPAAFTYGKFDFKKGTLYSEDRITKIYFPSITRYENYINTLIGKDCELLGREITIDKDFLKNIKCTSLRFTGGSRIGEYSNKVKLKGMNIELYNTADITSKYFSKARLSVATTQPIRFASFNTHIENCNITFNNVNPFIYFTSYPTIKNLNSNVEIIHIYSANLFDNEEELIKALNKIFVLGHEMEFKNGPLGDQIITKKLKSFKNIYSVKNNPKKYWPIRDIEFDQKGVVSELRDDINLSDAFSWVKSLKQLHTIQLSDNNIVVKFRKNQNPRATNLTKDGWNVLMYQKAKR